MWDLLFSQYKTYDAFSIWLEIIAVLFGLISVLFARVNNILVYPTGIISTLIFVYLLFQWSLIGDFLINIYYTIMSIYGWILWSKRKNDDLEYPIATMNTQEFKKSIVLFTLTTLFVIIIYIYFDKFTSWTAYVDTFTTGLFFVGMWLMAQRKIENWIVWIIADFISIPLYFLKGYTLTSLQYIVFTILAYYGYKEWKRILQP
ncbi:nicotinamide riboside transporter PnuC [Flavobacterium haoranii]|uniref:Nicotinamide riboside transporter PnuC n=1 Tax=Flavobacterium haoranii TaxID=683124 RepID=A0A1M6FIZ5_9FLAO|nr:nicotinamide riboside transporter PnuC [Flavobacterium haoranii]SHI97626.1 nicotinamide mononucleotide transporter [Flavobacterium haoranii]